MTRVTQSMMQRSMLANLNGSFERLVNSQEQLSTGFTINRPSDDPLGASRSMSLMTRASDLKQYESSLDAAKSWGDVTDSALANIVDLIHQVRELAVKGATDTYGPDERASIIQELTGILDSLKAQGNAKFGDEYVFAGTATSSPPYQLGPDDTYAGNTGNVLREVAPGVQVTINEPGINVLGDSNSGLLRSVRDLIGHLQSGDPADLEAARTTDLNAIDLALETATAAQARLGERQSRFEWNLARIADLQDANAELLASIREVDYGQAMVQFSSRAAIYQAALGATQKLLDLSLVTMLGK